MRLLAIVGAVLLGALLIFLGAFGARWFVPPTGDATPAVEIAAPTPPSPPVERAVARELDLESLRELLAVLDAGRKSQILDSKEVFEKFVMQETLNQAVLAAAYANGADNNESIRVLMERAGQRVLVEAYLNEVVRLNLDPNFPSEAQVREAFDQNPAVFRVPERMHLWQIFIALDEQADADASKAAWQLAEQLVAELKAGKASFEALAKRHSKHQASRVSDGYMGLITVDELLPPIATAARKLKLDGISAPVATATGLHIIKRGPVVEGELLDFEEVKANIRERLVREATLKLRQAAIEKIAEEYPVAAPAEDLENWRQDLLGGGTVTPAPAKAPKSG